MNGFLNSVRRLVVPAAFGVAVLLGGGFAAVHAKTVPVVQPACSILSVTTSTACQTVAGNNDSLSDMNTLGVLGHSNWTYGGKALDDDADDNVSPFNLSGTGKGTKSGNWWVDSFAGVTFAALIMKGGGEAWVAYLLDITKTTGMWSTADILNNGGQQPNLSHMTLYVVKGTSPPPPPPTVPVPAAGWLLLAGLGGLGALRSRKRL